MKNTKKNQPYLACPGCLDNLLQKDSRSIPFCRYANVYHLIQLCQKCSSNPNEERIRKNLEEFGWPEEAIKQAVRVIITGEITVVAEIVDGVIVPVKEAEETVIPVEEVVTTGEAVIANGARV